MFGLFGSSLMTIVFIYLVINIVLSDESIRPQTVKLAFTSNPSEMVISWFTEKENGDSLVHFSETHSTLLSWTKLQHKSGVNVTTSSAQPQNFTSDTWYGLSHTVLLSNLSPLTTYFYVVGGTSQVAYSQIFKFTTQAFDINTTATEPMKKVTPFHIAVYGDMGNGDGYNETVAHLKENMDRYNMVLHVGDISYCDYDKVEQGNQTVWNDFLKELEPITSKVPYMTTPGNHDVFYSLTAYQQTFGMPATSDEPWYSFNYNGVHFISISSESDLSPFTKQYQWIKADLEQYRRYNPNGWIIAYSHRPYYCSTQWDWCRKQTLRALIEATVGSLFQKYNVDIFLAGHTHAYERTYPVYQQLNIGNYDYPGGTVHMVIGTPGNQEGLDKDFIYPTPDWSASRFSTYGYAQLQVQNETHILWQFLGNQDRKILDQQWIVKGYFD
ncbi:hypothetical protein PPL_10614 [Heterostelium album PN500]|uniref:Purple acid phosphatase n=1 Tax=Heterostelium pallidum (strain ATCC 26659 / Pp 5 / PN500) TaxID=670386 RepID=D3BRK3_HETP5|nr:hypothetical protein PPL_10614 [Heterostelium album PN500]EFA76035.1 hypothetical protein PPL_10614 [Heterostelium album PN500]|eukprot:XP_020428169.1 hypothetical protein PPL_10614 [Heterostelium album PN500]